MVSIVLSLTLAAVVVVAVVIVVVVVVVVVVTTYHLTKDTPIRVGPTALSMGQLLNLSP